MWILNLLSQDYRDDQSLHSLIYYDKRLSDGQESNPPASTATTIFLKFQSA